MDAFRAYANAFPHRTILLLDTYDTIEGAHHAVVVGKELEEAGHRLVGVRLDSGDYLDLSRKVRGILDQAGLGYVQIVASGGLDEFEISRLVEGGAPIDIFGVGTRVSVSADAPYTDMSYKLACYENRPVMKLSPDKVSPPGTKQVYRVRDGQGVFERDIVALREEDLPGGEALLETVMEQGQRTRPAPALAQAREWFNHDFERLGEHFKRIVNPPRYPVAFSSRLQRLTDQTQSRLMEQLDNQD